MSENDMSLEILDILDQEIILDELNPNKRAAVRYRRKDIKAVVKISNFFYPRLIPVILQDISSKGAGIKSPKKLGKKRQRVSLHLLFNDGARFDISAVIVHSLDDQAYGLKFLKYHQLLAEHLLHTQTDLHFS